MSGSNGSSAVIYRGEVLWFRDDKGYGFIRTEDGREVFVHYSGIDSRAPRRNLQPGQRVQFELLDGPKGPYASQVKVVTG